MPYMPSLTQAMLRKLPPQVQPPSFRMMEQEEAKPVSQQRIQSTRTLSDAMRQNLDPAPQTDLGGAGNALKILGAALMERRANKAEERNQESDRNALVQALMGVRSGNPDAMLSLASTSSNPEIQQFALDQMMRETQTAQSQRQLEAQADALGLQGQQRALFLANPDALTGTMAGNMEAFTLNKGDVRNDPLSGRSWQGAPDLPSSVQEFQFGQGDPAFNDWLLQRQRAGAAQTNVSFGQNEFQNALGKAEGEMFAGFFEQGATAARNLRQIDQLEGLLANVNTGGGAAIRQRLGEMGIASEGLSDIQAAQALISSMVPQQRPPGSGQMSDADLALFMQSLPRIINQPGGNQLIIDTMRGINQYDLQLGQIAQAAASGQITRDQAREAVNSLQNPIEPLKAALGQEGARPAAAPLTPQEQQELEELRRRFGR